MGEAIDKLISRYLNFAEKTKKANEDGRVPLPEHQNRLNAEKVGLKEEIEQLTKKANLLFDKKDRQKTLMLTINEYLLSFLGLAFTGNRAYTTLEKWMGRKRKYQGFLAYRYKLEDIPLAKMEYSFIEEVFKYMLVQHEMIENTAMKYAQCIKEMMDRAVAKGWIPSNDGRLPLLLLLARTEYTSSIVMNYSEKRMVYECDVDSSFVIQFGRRILSKQ